jgi:hypothetical protein
MHIPIRDHASRKGRGLSSIIVVERTMTVLLSNVTSNLENAELNARFAADWQRYKAGDANVCFVTTSDEDGDIAYWLVLREASEILVYSMDLDETIEAIAWSLSCFGSEAAMLEQYPMLKR